MAFVIGEGGVSLSSLSCVMHILRLVIVLPFLQDRSQLQLQFGGIFIDLNSMLDLFVVVVSSSAKWSISRLVPLRSSSVLSSPSK